MVDIDKAIRTAVDGGKVELGTRSGVRAKDAKLVVLSANCSDATRKDVTEACTKASVPIVVYKGTSIELGAVCGKPFAVSVITVLEAGTSNILELAAKK